MRKPELLSPAGTLKNMRYAFAYGPGRADHVRPGADHDGARALAAQSRFITPHAPPRYTAAPSKTQRPRRGTLSVFLYQTLRLGHSAENLHCWCGTCGAPKHLLYRAYSCRSTHKRRPPRRAAFTTPKIPLVQLDAGVGQALPEMSKSSR